MNTLAAQPHCFTADYFSSNCRKRSFVSGVSDTKEAKAVVSDDVLLSVDNVVADYYCEPGDIVDFEKKRTEIDRCLGEIRSDISRCNEDVEFLDSDLLDEE